MTSSYTAGDHRVHSLDGRCGNARENAGGTQLAGRARVRALGLLVLLAGCTAEPVRPGVYRIKDLVEKPAPDRAPSDLAIIGRYLLTPDVFDALEATAGDRGGEIQLTNGLKRLLETRPLYACEITGTRHDTGNKLGFLKAVVYFALRRPDLAGPFRDYLKTLNPA